MDVVPNDERLVNPLNLTDPTHGSYRLPVIPRILDTAIAPLNTLLFGTCQAVNQKICMKFH